MGKYYIGVDLGGTNIAAGIVDKDGKIYCKKSVRTNLPKPESELENDIFKLCKALCEENGYDLHKDIINVGIGSPGSVDGRRGIVWQNVNFGYENWQIKANLEKLFEIPVYVENDANAAIIAEVMAGSAKDCKNALIVTLGTGVGGGAFINGEIYAGSNYAGLEVGHVVIVKDGRQCNCGRKGCFERYASASALTRDTQAAMKAHPESAMWKICPDVEIAKWEARSNNWKNVFDPSHNLMRGRNLDGTFQEPFSPYKWGGAFTEGNAWHYTWSVFHDVDGLMEAMGGAHEFASMLDSVFVVPPIYDDSYYGYRIHEITEMQVADMGNYAHGNQPAQHMIYLYNWAGQPWKTQKWVREVMDRLYSATPDGYCGDEDNGQTSAWYVFSALGFYPVCPGSDEYAVGAPLFKKAVVHLENGCNLEINAPDNGPENRYVRSMKVNCSRWNESFLKHKHLAAGAVIDFNMTENPKL